MKITILYEDKNLLAVNKPSGLVIHTDGRTKEEALTNWLKKKYPKNGKIGEPFILASGESTNRFGIMHRLDRETSGVVLIAKNQKTYDFLKKQFVNRKIEKKYLAVVYGDLRYDEGVINIPIGRDKNDFRKRATGKSIRGEEREAITYYKTLRRRSKLSLVEANPQTGRTHQLRVHFASLGHGIVGDKMYGVYKKSPISAGRLALHAYTIEFELPSTTPRKKGKLIKITAPYPTDFKKTVEFFS